MGRLGLPAPARRVAGLPGRIAGLPRRVAGPPRRGGGGGGRGAGLPRRVAGRARRVAGLPRRIAGLPRRVTGVTRRVADGVLSLVRAARRRIVHAKRALAGAVCGGLCRAAIRKRRLSVDVWDRWLWPFLEA